VPRLCDCVTGKLVTANLNSISIIPSIEEHIFRWGKDSREPRSEFSRRKWGFRRGRYASRWTAPPLRNGGRLKEPASTRGWRRCLFPGRFKIYVRTVAPLHRRASAIWSTRLNAGPQTGCAEFAVGQSFSRPEFRTNCRVPVSYPKPSGGRELVMGVGFAPAIGRSLLARLSVLIGRRDFRVARRSGRNGECQERIMADWLSVFPSM